MAYYGLPGGWELLFICAATLPGLLVVALVVVLVRKNSAGAAANPPAPQGWFPDPERRHELRFWDGSTWTTHVSDSGVVTDEGAPKPDLGPPT